MNQRWGIFIGSGIVVALLIGGSLLLVSSPAPATPALSLVSTTTVTGYQLVSQVRVNSDTFDYTYRVLVTNSEPRLQNITAIATTSTANVTIIDGTVSFGTLQIGQTATSTDTITIRQVRTQAFSSPPLKWTFSGTADFTSQDGVIKGYSDAPSVDAMPDYFHGIPILDAEISNVPGIGRIIRVQLGIEFQLSTTVAQANGLLRQLGAVIVSTVAGSNIFEVRIPDPGSIAALHALRERIA